MSDPLRNIPKLNVIRMLFWMHFFSPVLVPFFMQWGGLKLSQVLFLNSWFMFWNFLLDVPTGTIADKIGRKFSLVLGSAIVMIGAVLYVSKPSLYVFLVAEVVFALGYTFHTGADEALAYDSLLAAGVAERSKQVLSRMEAFKLGGIVVSGPVGGWLAYRWGLTAPVKAYLVPAAIAALLAMTILEPPRSSEKRRLGLISLVKEGGTFFLRHPVLLRLTLEMALTNALAWTIIWLYQPLIQSHGVPIVYFGAIQVFACLGQILFLTQVDRIERKLGSRRRLLVCGSFLTGLFFVVLGFSHRVEILIPAIVLAFVFGLSRLPIYSSYMNKYIDSDHRATMLSMVSMGRTLAIVFINPIVGWASDRSLPITLASIGVALVLLSFFSPTRDEDLID